MYKLLFLIMIMFGVILFSSEIVSARGLELLSTATKSFKRLPILEQREIYTNPELEEVPRLFSSRYVNNVLWSVPVPLYVLDEKNISEDQERRKKVEHYLLQEEFRRNPDLRKALKVYYANSLQRFYYLLKAKFQEGTEISNYREASSYILKIKQEQKNLLDQYLSLFSVSLNSQEKEDINAETISLEIIKKYGEGTLAYINELYSRFPSLALNFVQVKSASGNVLVGGGSGEHALVLGALNPEIQREYILNLSPQGFTVITLGDLRIKNFFISNESLIKVCRLDNEASLKNALAIQSLANAGAVKLVINTDAGVLNFNLKLSPRVGNVDFELERPVIKVKGVYRLEEGAFLTIRTHSLMAGKILASNPSLTDLEHLVSSQDKDFLKIFLLRIKSVGNTEIIVPSTEKIYKLKLEILKSGSVKDGLQEIYLD